MSLGDNYTWEAQKAGEIITKGGDLTGCNRLSFIPQIEGLPRVDVAGVEMIRRFGRGFAKSKFGKEKLHCKLLWEQGSDKVKTPEDVSMYICAGMLIARVGRTFPWYVVTDVTDTEITIHKPYEKKTKKAETRYLRMINTNEYLHCVVCKGFRMYVNARTGQIITTPENYELYM